MSGSVQNFKEPKALDRKTKPRCDECRNSKKSCSFSPLENGPWPARCELCMEKKLACSKPTKVCLKRPKKQPPEVSHDEAGCLPEYLPHLRHIGLKPLSPISHGHTLPDRTTLAATETSERYSKEAILLLSLHAILLMAAKEMIDAAVVMSRPQQRDATRECTEDRIPVLEQAVSNFKMLAYQVRNRMLNLSGGASFARAQDSINALATPYFRQEFTWGIDRFALEDTRASISWFYNHGHFGLVYVLQTKLLQAGVPPTRDEIARLLTSKQNFMQALDDLIARDNLPFSFPSQWRRCQMFAPQELVRVPAVAMHILNDRRPDFLGRLSFHILSDAGATMTWKISDQGGSGYSVRCFWRDFSASVVWPPEALDSTDILGRTALHIAARQGGIRSVNTLSRSGANMHRLCLNGLSLLHIAACHGHAVVVHYLIEKMHYHECNAQCYTATEKCQENETRYLLQLDEVDGLWRTPFWYAARGSHFEVMSLLAKGVVLKVSSKQLVPTQADTERADSYGQSASTIAARDGRVSVLKYLLSLRSESWNPVLEPLMINEHLLLAYAVQSRTHECIKLVLSQRQWRFGGPVFARAMEYANQNHDQALRDELFHLYKVDEAVRTANPVTGLTHHRPVDIPGIDYTTDLSPFITQFPNLVQTPDPVV